MKRTLGKKNCVQDGTLVALLVAVVIQCAAFWDAIAVQAIRQAIL